MSENKKAVVKRSFARVISETKVENGKTVTESRCEEWSDQPEQIDFDRDDLDEAMDKIGKTFQNAFKRRFPKERK